ncbi:MAG: galactokinase [Chloroflexi bacterium]|nr:galactokinase [Chloroflexota bacterium]
MTNLETLRTEFTKHFSVSPKHIFRAPGRVNLIGEHTDYNDGFVLPIAIDRAMLIAARKRNDRIVRMVALDLREAQAEFSLDAPIERVEKNKWSNYVRGVAWAMQARGLLLSGVDLMMHGDVPIGSGLSSSAALEVCTATMFREMSELEISKLEIVRLCQRAENEFVGVKSGIMDQFISALAQTDSALLIDCRDLSYQNVTLPHGVTFVVCDTSKRRGLVDSEYNTRRAECEQAAKFFGVKALRDVSFDRFERSEKDLPPMVAKRARHVVTENARVLQAVEAAKQNDLTTFGKLMNASHESLRDDYQVSCAELDTMVEIARQQPGCLGARLTGAGFGGCTVNLVEDKSVDAFVANVAREYQRQTGLTPQVYACHAMAGAGKLA